MDIPEGALFYGQTRHREQVTFTDELRGQVRAALSEMHELYRRGHTPRVKPTKSCNACSLKELCLPRLMRTRSASAYDPTLVDMVKRPAPHGAGGLKSRRSDHYKIKLRSRPTWGGWIEIPS